jgi:serine O-acetyltransferase
MACAGSGTVEWHRIGHWFWRSRCRDLAHFLPSHVSEVFSVLIHPAVPVGRAVFFDRGTSLVIAEPAVIGDGVSTLQQVTLSGTGKERRDRHPKVRDGVPFSAGARIFGNNEISHGASTMCRLASRWRACRGASSARVRRGDPPSPWSPTSLREFAS